jgi:hypothetical protein
MTLYARLNPDTGLTEVRDFVDGDVDSFPRPERGWRLLTLISPPTPSASQVLVGPTISFTETGAKQVWSLRNKTAQELETEWVMTNGRIVKKLLPKLDYGTANNREMQFVIAWLIRKSGV